MIMRATWFSRADVDAYFSAIWDNLDIGLMGLVLARRGPWTLTLDGVYFKIADQRSKTVAGPFGQVSVKGALEVSASVTVLQPSLWYCVRDDRTKVDLGAGYCSIPARLGANPVWIREMESDGNAIPSSSVVHSRPCRLST